MDEWVEVKGKSVEVAVKAALEELGIRDEAGAEVKVLQPPQRGFLGIGRQDAIVRVKPGRKQPRRRSRGGRKRGSSRGARQQRSGADTSAKASRVPANKQKQTRGGKTNKASRGSRPSDVGRRTTGGRAAEREVQAMADEGNAAETLGNEQAEVIERFLSGLLEEFGLEGEVDTRFDGRVLHADIKGEQTEALVGSKATVMQAVHELTKTVVQRKTAKNCRLRVDIAGYGEKRRRALGIYAVQLAGQVIEEGGEVMLEPMNASDRKVVHDAVAEVEGIRSYSEGTEPRRSVVISAE